jgi:phospholipid/cholesterol/gamma-HCH transport system ATP-binding protein
MSMKKIFYSPQDHDAEGVAVHDEAENVAPHEAGANSPAPPKRESLLEKPDEQKFNEDAGSGTNADADSEANARAKQFEKEHPETIAEHQAEEHAADERANDDNLDEPRSSEDDGPVVSIKGLYKAFKDHEVLRGVDLEVKKGENVVVLGKSGSGKSVLIKCLVGLEWPDAGELKIFGRDISTLNYRDLNNTRLRTGFLFQNAALYDSMTVKENLAFPLRQHKKNMSSEKKKELIMEMLENVGLADSVDQMPSKLSGGQQKRIGLARTLILRPEVMLYDEPTTGLDTGTSKEISELILRMQKKYNISSILITHDMACARMTADRIVMMKEGQIIAQGTYEELEKSDDEWIKSFFDVV